MTTPRRIAQQQQHDKTNVGQAYPTCYGEHDDDYGDDWKWEEVEPKDCGCDDEWSCYFYAVPTYYYYDEELDD